MAGHPIRCAWDSFSAMRNPGVDQNFTDLAPVVQLRLRVVFGLQALQRCSGLLNRRARGSTVATHHFGGGTRIEKFYEEPCVPSAANKASAFRGLLRFKRSRSSMYRAPRFERGGCRRESRRECQFHLRDAIYDFDTLASAVERVADSDRKHFQLLAGRTT